MITPAQRRLRAQIAAFSLHAQGKTTTSAARAAFLTGFERQVDPKGILSPEERIRRATAARKAYFCRLALKRHRSACQRGGDAA